jgi:hypothetical protein
MSSTVSGVSDKKLAFIDACALVGCRFKSLLGQHVPNSTGSSRIRRSKTSVAVVHVSSLAVASLNLFLGNVSPTVPENSPIRRLRTSVAVVYRFFSTARVIQKLK